MDILLVVKVGAIIFLLLTPLSALTTRRLLGLCPPSPQ